VSNRVEKSEVEWREQLTPEQYGVTRGGATEPAFSGEYWDCKRSGVYRCVCCGVPLFRSQAKYDSGSGWPSFWEPVADDAVTSVADPSHGMLRVEIRCSSCDAHLGHVFPDGSPPTERRYCVNSASLGLDPDA
jgi:peptide-methionine (R)-S-oxide reductase